MNSEHYHELLGSYRVSVSGTSTNQQLHNDCRRVRIQCTHSNVTFEVGVGPQTATDTSHFLCPKTGGLEMTIPPNSHIAFKTVAGGVILEDDDNEQDDGPAYVYISELIH